MGKAKKRTAKVGRGKMGEAARPPPRSCSLLRIEAGDVDAVLGLNEYLLHRRAIGNAVVRQVAIQTRYRDTEAGCDIGLRPPGSFPLGDPLDECDFLAHGPNQYITTLVIGKPQNITKVVNDSAEVVMRYWGMTEKPKFPNHLRHYRERKGLSQPQLAKLAETSVQNISRLERGDRQLTKPWAEKLAPHLGVGPQMVMFHEPGDDIGHFVGSLSQRVAGVDVEGFDEVDLTRLPLRGEVAAGRWLETPAFLDWNEITDYVDGISVPPSQREFTYGLVVRGTSVNKIAQDGEVIVCLDAASGIEVHERDVVVVERLRADGALREVTAKRLARREGKLVLMPESTDPMWQTPIPIEDLDHEGTEIRIVAKVKFVIRPV